MADPDPPMVPRQVVHPSASGATTATAAPVAPLEPTPPPSSHPDPYASQTPTLARISLELARRGAAAKEEEEGGGAKVDAVDTHGVDTHAVDAHEDRDTPPPHTPPPPFSHFTPSMRRYIVVCASLAGFWSPFAINIYIPALPSVTQDLGESTTLINLSVTVYMIFQGLSPMIWAPLSDTLGRRPLYLLTFAVFLCGNLGLAFTHSYALLMVLRIVQACGASSAIAIGSGTIGDISAAGERGSYMGWYAFGQFIGPAVGPVVGGALSERYGWNGIFFFLSAAGGLFWAGLALAMPETLRILVGDGSRVPRGIWKVLLPLPGVPRRSRLRQRGQQVKEMHLPLQGQGGWRNYDFGFAQPLMAFRRFDTVSVIMLYSLVYAAYYVSSTSLADLVEETYGLSQLLAGLCFLPSGIGCALGSVLGGKMLDVQFARAARKAQRQRGDGVDGGPGSAVDVHRVRLQSAWVYLPIFCTSFLIYGWTIHFGVNLAVPLVFQFILGAAATAFFTNITTLIVDLYPGKAASATAANNIGRCLFGAGAVGVTNPLFEAIGTGWTFTFFALLTLCGCGALQALTATMTAKWAEEARQRDGADGNSTPVDEKAK